ncbi:MAG TPA: hypothetical protein VN628_14105 [Vicinamibacterales bacterium]|nr:hypothetical protein [Vicinamibacterales bacterium]
MSRIAGLTAADARVLHGRPALLQDLQWRPPFVLDDASAKDPVEDIVFSFYNDQLFRIVIEYDRRRTEGMTDGDMAAAMSALYGPATAPVLKDRRPSAPIMSEAGARIAAWADADFSAVLSRQTYGSGFRMVVTSVRLDALARIAEAEGARLDEQDAPRIAADKQKKAESDTLAAQEKARLKNKAAFRP